MFDPFLQALYYFEFASIAITIFAVYRVISGETIGRLGLVLLSLLAIGFMAVIHMLLVAFVGFGINDGTIHETGIYIAAAYFLLFAGLTYFFTTLTALRVQDIGYSKWLVIPIWAAIAISAYISETVSGVLSLLFLLVLLIWPGQKTDNETASTYST